MDRRLSKTGAKNRFYSMYLGRVEGGAGGGGAHQTKLAVNPEAEILKLAAHAQAVRHRLLLDVEILNTRGSSNRPSV
jgi:hypothetical protein